MSIHELFAVVAPPTVPLETGTEGAWRAVEQSLGLRFPNDLYELSARYGSGHFMGVTIYNPFSPNYQAILKQDLTLFRSLRESEGPGAIPYAIFPEVPGLLPCGSEVNGGALFWRVQDQNSDNWELVLMASVFRWEVLHMSLTSFLAKSFRKELECIWWDRTWQDEEFMNVSFAPEPLTQ